MKIRFEASLPYLFILQASLGSEKERADDSLRKYGEEQKKSEEKQRKLEGIEEKSRHLQDHLNRLLNIKHLSFYSSALFLQKISQ